MNVMGQISRHVNVSATCREPAMSLEVPDDAPRSPRSMVWVRLSASLRPDLIHSYFHFILQTRVAREMNFVIPFTVWYDMGQLQPLPWDSSPDGVQSSH